SIASMAAPIVSVTVHVLTLLPATSFLWPFKLSNPNGGFRTRKAPQWIEGGEAGKREQHINALVRRAN
ncbi:uncharacterized protein JCM10292_002930, partial [Rhodotorula paludigena]|uniref:uncharacterized protein n=1 Tax=Rhodotorula paludigena TaxID=86838 RepID=UPI003172E697